MVTTAENYARKLEGVAIGYLYARLDDPWAMTVGSVYDGKTDKINIGITYHGYRHAQPLEISISMVEDNRDVPAVIEYAMTLLEDPFMRSLPTQLRDDARSRARQLQAEHAKADHPVMQAINAMHKR